MQWFSADEGGPVEPQGHSSQPLSVQVQSHCSPATPSGCQEKGRALKWQPPLHQSLATDPDSTQSMAFRGWAISGSKAWVFMLGGDLIVGVIGLATLGLDYLHSGPATLGLACLHIACLSLAWFLSPNTHWLIILISTIFPTLAQHNPSIQQQSYMCSPQSSTGFSSHRYILYCLLTLYNNHIPVFHLR
jgi:hypothetical protein